MLYANQLRVAQPRCPNCGANFMGIMVEVMTGITHEEDDEQDVYTFDGSLDQGSVSDIMDKIGRKLFVCENDHRVYIEVTEE
jgi:hypothetical protein